MKILEWLKMPEVRSISDLDDPSTTLLHAEIIQKKPFLKKLYADFYRQLRDHISEPENRTIVELGSGGGFIKDIINNVITSDILELPNVDRVFSASEMPFENTSVDAFLMFNVLHHITEPRVFFREAVRCLKTGGQVIMIEPAATPWAKFIYKNFHHELFDQDAEWELEKLGPLSHGNDALPWIIFCRDRNVFENEFPSLKIVGIHNHTPFAYLLSGGLTLRQLLPSFTYTAVKAAECALSPLNRWLGMFQTIELQKAG